ncbi:uncharacterized protein LOC143074346 [Mytilus galloprovincialis]|uniref:uncharacterized protein LOC143074346 n=1 Tax=Mytilus galloprovincialis TaxID=29158 RepID=UPI003F7B7149
MNTKRFVDSLLVLLIMGRTVMTINWSVVNNLVIFGRDVILRCHVGNIDCNVSGTAHDTRTWTGGQHYKLLCTTEGSTDPKYKMMTRNTSHDFDLSIGNFSESDLDYEYTCQCGHEVNTTKLSVEQNKLISFPTEINTDSSYIASGDQLHIAVSLEKVNPVPICSTLFKDKVIAEANVTKLKSYRYFTDVNVSFTFPLQEFGCSGSLQIVCSLLSYNVTVFNENIQSCPEYDSPFHLHIPLVTACSVFLLAIFCIVYIIKRRHPCRNQHFDILQQQHEKG